MHEEFLSNNEHYITDRPFALLLTHNIQCATATFNWTITYWRHFIIFFFAIIIYYLYYSVTLGCGQ